MASSLHHASIIEAEQEAGIAWAYAYIEKELGITPQGNPDIETITCNRFTIDDARQLKLRANQAPLGDAQVFILYSESILHEAQNALLKLFEEPVPGTYFIIILPTRRGLLPTVQSRLSYHGRIVSDPAETLLAEKFLRASVASRTILLQPLLKNKDRVQARALIDALEALLHKEGVKKHVHALREIYFIRTYLRDTSSSLKMLLEHLAVVV